MDDVVESRARGTEDPINVPKHLAGLSVRVRSGERTSIGIEAGRPRDEELTATNNGVTVRTDRFVEFQLDARPWHVLVVTANVPVQRPHDVYWMLALYPSRPPAIFCLTAANSRAPLTAPAARAL